MKNKNYPSDRTRKQFKSIQSILESARHRTCPRKYDLYDVFNALLYLLKTGCQWRMLPKEYPNYKSVHAYFRIWSEVPKGQSESILDRVLKKNGLQTTHEKWKKGKNKFHHRGRTER